MDISAHDHTGKYEAAMDDIWGGQILLVSDDPQLCALYTHAIELVGGRCAPLSMGSLDDDLPRRMNIAAIIIQITESNSCQTEALGRVARFCAASNLPLFDPD